MKIFSVFSLIALVHIALIGTLLVQPGCQNKSEEAPSPEVTRVDQNTNQFSRDQPTAPQRTTVDSAFNSGVQSSSSETRRTLSEPMRPVVDTDMTREIDNSVLQPVLDPVRESVRSGESSTYTVQRGDTLSKIARSENVSLAELMSANSLTKSSTIFVGQVLLIPTSSVERVTVSTPSANVATSSYTVRSGDNLSSIAKRNGVTVAMLKSVNGLRSDIIRVGQELLLPSVNGNEVRQPEPTTTRSTSPQSSGSTYTVQGGDTPSGIAKKFGVTSQALMGINGISDPRKLFVGQELIIPTSTGGGSSTRTSATASASAPILTSTSAAAASRPLVISSPSTPTSSGQTTTGGNASSSEDPMALLEALEDDDIPYSEVEEVNESSGN